LNYTRNNFQYGLLSTIMRLQAHLAKSRRFLAGEGYCSAIELHPRHSL